MSLFGFAFVSVLATAGAFVAVMAMLAAWFIQAILVPPYVSHRRVWYEGSVRLLSWGQVAGEAAHTFLLGRYHSASLHTGILAARAVTAVVALVRRRREGVKWTVAALVVAGLLAASQALPSCQGLDPIWNTVPVARTVHVRFHWFLPTLWFVVLGMLVATWRRWSRRQYWIDALLVAHLLWVASATVEAQGELRQNYETLWSRARGLTSKAVSYREFAAERLFTRIDEHIGRPKASYRVVSIGLHPACP